MAKKLEFWGGIGTVAYLTVIAAKVAFNFDSFIKLNLNELGDFLAGAFGPVAFLWLVLGFLQQGKELKLSTDALQLQAKELKNSVEQQSIIADAAVRQIQAATKALDLQMQEAERALVANFEVRNGLKSQTDSKSIKNQIKIKNHRNVAYKVKSEISGDLPFNQSSEHGTLMAGDEVLMEVEFGQGMVGKGEFVISYEDVSGNIRADVLKVSLDEDGWTRFEKVREKTGTIISA